MQGILRDLFGEFNEKNFHSRSFPDGKVCVGVILNFSLSLSMIPFFLDFSLINFVSKFSSERGVGCWR